MYKWGKWGPKLRCDLDRNSDSLSFSLPMTPPIWWLMIMGHVFLYFTHGPSTLFFHPLITVSQGRVKEFNNDQKFCLHGAEFCLVCSWHTRFHFLKWNLTSLYHSPRTWARVLFPGPLRALTAAMFVQAEGDRGQEGTKSQGSRFDLESSILFSSHPLSGPCGVQVSFLEAFHSCSYFRI